MDAGTDRADSEVMALYKLLASDVNHCLGQLDAAPDNQFYRRQLVRCVFALQEGVCFALKQVALALYAEGDVLFTPAELSILTEASHDLDHQGRVSSRPANLRFLPNLRFAFSAYAKSHRTAFTVDASDHGWERLRRSVGVRNRITHPKSQTDVVVSDTDVQETLDAHWWFGQQIQLVFIAVQGALVQELERLIVESSGGSISTAEIAARRDRFLAEIAAELSDPGGNEPYEQPG